MVGIISVVIGDHFGGGDHFDGGDHFGGGTSNCAVTYKGAWWYTSCHASNLNGLYHHGKHKSGADGVNWYAWKGHHYSAKTAEMKIRPVDF